MHKYQANAQCVSHSEFIKSIGFYLLTELARCLKTTILKIGKPNYRFFENRIRLPLQKEFLYKSSILEVPRLITFGEQALAGISL